MKETRVPLFRVRELYEAGYSIEEISTDIYPHLEPGKIMAALRGAGYGFSDTGAPDTYTSKGITGMER